MSFGYQPLLVGLRNIDSAYGCEIPVRRVYLCVVKRMDGACVVDGLVPLFSGSTMKLTG